MVVVLVRFGQTLGTRGGALALLMHPMSRTYFIKLLKDFTKRDTNQA